MAEGLVRVVSLGENQIKQAAVVLARAFQDDPLYSHMYPDAGERARVLPLIFEWNVRYGHLFGEVQVTDEPLAGVVICLRPGETEWNAKRLAESGFYRLAEVLGADAWRRYAVDVFAYAEEQLRHAAPDLYWYLETIGVEPNRQGRGVGSALLRAVHDRADAGGMATVLLTFQPRNLRFYRHYGYDIACEGTEPTSGLRFWCLWRPANPSVATVNLLATAATKRDSSAEGDEAQQQSRYLEEPDSASGSRTLSSLERQQLLVEWNATAAPYPRDRCVHELFEAQVARTPEAIAVVCGEEQLTYHQLNARANQVAHHLQELNVGPEVLVGICAERSLDMVVGILGILKAGGAYVPLDPAYPPERLAFMLEDAQTPVLLSQKHLLGRLPAYRGRVVCLDADAGVLTRQSKTNPTSDTKQDNLAYVIYTSGSTGTPKGVLGLHRGILNRCHWMWQAYPFANQEVYCHTSSFSFVDSVWELFGPLLHQVKTVIASELDRRDPHSLVRVLVQQQVTRMDPVISLLTLLLNSDIDLQRELPQLKYWSTGAEALSADLAQWFRERVPQGILINLYGSSEVAADATFYEASEDASAQPRIPIGRPIANTRVYVLDERMEPVPIGVPGELYIGGDGLARGYLGRPDLTAEKFVPDPFGDAPDSRLFRTGDLARWRPDGNLEHLGRVDDQVKIRGFRVELGEVEATLVAHPAVQSAALVARDDVTASKRLIAFIVPHQQPGPTTGELRDYLAARLPEYMVPSAFVPLEHLPLTPSGKVDRKALPVTSTTRLPQGTPFHAPRTDDEEVVARIWADALGLERVSVHDNFFGLGGDSLLAMSVVARVQHAIQVELPVIVLFTAPTVAEMASTLRTTRPPALAGGAIKPAPREPYRISSVPRK